MRLVLYLLSILYGIITEIRNRLFDYEIIKSRAHNVHIICVGNLSVGGTGKTPHVNYIAGILSEKHQVAILSRGYKRKSSGFKYVKLNSSPIETGDEPLMLKTNNPQCVVAVEKNRNYAVDKILYDYPKTEIILMDDGFQHRRIKAGRNIIITACENLLTNDYLIPLGSLRESKKETARANIIIVSRTPRSMTSIEKKRIIIDLKIRKDQSCYFSTIKYLNYRCLKTNQEIKNEEEYSITLICGIADPNHNIKYLTSKKTKVTLIKFSDHHNYTNKDIEKILAIHNKNKSLKKLILTTEKDATKLKAFIEFFNNEKLYYIPIKIELNNEEIFKKQILDYVRKN